MQRAAELMKSWCEKHALPGMKIEIVRLPGLTPLLYIEVPASGGAAARTNDCVLLYGHMDKQPEFSGWAEGLDPWQARAPRRSTVRPRRRGRRLRRVRLAACAASAGGPEHPVRAQRDSDRRQRGERQPRPARLHRRAGRSHRRAVAGRVPRCRVRQLRSVLVYDFAARQSRRHAARRGAERKACTRAWPAASCRRVSGSHGACWSASRTRKRAS